MSQNSYILGFVAVIVVISGYFLFDSRTRLAPDSQAISERSKEGEAARKFIVTESKPKQAMSTQSEQKVPMQTTLRKSTPAKKSASSQTTTADSTGSVRSRTGPPSKRF